jgi:hypothetical protein
MSGKNAKRLWVLDADLAAGSCSALVA